jgi:hypothetical protein
MEEMRTMRANLHTEQFVDIKICATLHIFTQGLFVV